MNELQECHRLVWAFRKEIEPYWATPDPLNSLRYACTECAEAMDAWLRAERPSDSRNNERQNDVLDELADCAIMLLTAVQKFEFECPQHNESFPFLSLDELVIDIGALFTGFDSVCFTTNVMVPVSRIANYPGMELKQRIQGRLRRIAQKNLPNTESYEFLERVFSLL